MINKYVLDSDTLLNLEKRKALRKKLACQMLLESKFTKFTKWGIGISLFCLAMYFIHHDLFYGHFLHITLHG